MSENDRFLLERGFELKRVPDLHNPDDTRLVLIDLNDRRFLPLAVDFLDPQMIHRLKHGLGKQQPMGRALGLKTLKPGEEIYVLDLTAGMGVDAFFIAALGCRVLSLERSPVVAALLEDGLRRLNEAVRTHLVEPSSVLESVRDRLSFKRSDALTFLEALSEEALPDVIYMDPMYPDENRSESALPKKAMQMFRRLVGDDLDAESVLKLARQKARQRVVVKRPLRAPYLDGRPTHSYEGKTARYDMYQS